MDPRFVRRCAAALCAALLASSAPTALGQSPGAPVAAGEPATEAQARALAKARETVVGLRAKAVADARSARSLGPVREGSGVVIGSDGLVLTIGYLILEAENVELLLEGDRSMPARVVAYDQATGFGLVQALAPLRVPWATLGDAAGVTPAEPLMVASGGDAGVAGMARMLSRRPFSGYWEYHIDVALFTFPPRTDHSGAGLFNNRGELIGIGSLVLRNAAAPGEPEVPGNMFVPVDLLKPVLDEMRQRGTSHLSVRPWMGLNCIEQDGEVHVVNVNEESPAEVAGLQPGDRIVRIDGVEVKGLEVLWKRLWRGDRPERDVTLEIRRGEKAQTLQVHAVDRMKTLRKAEGI